MKKIIYVEPDHEVGIDELESMSKHGELLHFAKNDNNCHVYDTIEAFAEAFNNEYVSDQGFMFVEEEAGLPEKAMVLYEVDEEDNTKTSIVAMKETDWQKRKPEAIEKVLREYFDERYAGCDDEYFCYEDEIKQAVEALTTGYDTEFNGDSLFWDSVEMI